ncbi:MAG: DUF7134 domain-containing protein [Streptosporangiaceae bacterium]
MYAWLRRHPRLVDGVLAAALAFGGLVTAIGLQRYLVIPVTVALTVPVIFRRTHPVGAFWTATAVGAIQLVTWSRPVPPDLAILVLLYTLAAYTTRRKSVLGLAACLFGSAAELGELYTHLVRYGVANWLMIGAVLLAGPSVLAWLLGDAMRYRRAYYLNLEERAARLERDRDVQAKMAAAAERARIARELHDVVAHNVSVMVVQADGAAYALASDPERTRQALAAIAATGRQALAEMRVMLGLLRRSGETESATAFAPAGQLAAGLPATAQTAALSASALPAALSATAPTTPAFSASGQPATGQPTTTAARSATVAAWSAGTAAPAATQPTLTPAKPIAREPGPRPAAQSPNLAPIPGIGQLDDLLDQARAAGLAVSCTIEGPVRPLSSGTELAAYRIIQESLTNTRKHGGPGARASVGLRYRQDAIEVTVTDNGIGAAAPCDGGGHGLTGMRERVALYDGTLAVGPLPGGGFAVRAALPATLPQAGAA